MTALFDVMRAECAANGRDPAEIELSAGGGGRTLDEISARVESLRQLGVARVLLPPLPGERLNALADGLRERFGIDV